MTEPAAEGVRVAWADMPGSVRAAIEDVCGAPVTGARTQPGGFSPGVAARLRCADGARWFVKAVSAEANPDSPRMHRREAQHLAALEPLIEAGTVPAPRLRGTVDIGPWFALVLEDVDGLHPALPWLPADIAQVMAVMDGLADALTPAPIPVRTFAEVHARMFTGWRTLAGATELAGASGLAGATELAGASGLAGATELAGLDPWSRAHLDELAELESGWAEHSAGHTLLHGDIRADNLLLTQDRGLVIVDWPHACRGAAFAELVLFAPSVAMQGGPELAGLLGMSRAGQRASRESVTAVLCAMAGFLTCHALQPPPPGLPTVRAFQAAQGLVARRWLAERL